MYIRLILIILLFSYCQEVCAQINIWEGTKTKKVELIPYLVEGKDNASIVVCPGGSYFWHDMKSEGKEVAEWLNEMGISAFILKYRTAYTPAFITHFRYFIRGNRYPDAQMDLERTIKLLKDNFDQYGINKEKIGVMGFSAGGHLAMSVTEYADKDSYPSFIACIYPVVSMSSQYTHKRSRRALLGDDKKNNKILQDSLSIEKHIPEDCPPVFLINCQDDPIVHYRNSELLDSALTRKNIPHKYIQYKTGGHGFGVSNNKGTTESNQWKNEFIKWLKDIKII